MKRDLLKRAIPTVLSVFGVGGVFGTAVLAVMATPKAERIIAEKKKEKEAPLTKKEIVKAVWKNYIPAAVIGVSSAICIASANILNRKQINSLNGALAIMAGTYNRYKDKIKELFGDEAHEKVMSAIAADKSNSDKIYAPSITKNTTLDFGNPEEELLFYDEYMDRYFRSTASRVLQAEYHLNRNFVLSGYASLSEFYDFLGLEHSEATDNIGWDCCDMDIMWIDFDHSKIVTDDGLEVHMIEMIFQPIDHDDDGNVIEA